jgi:Ca-activated chloride channel homolog
MPNLYNSIMRLLVAGLSAVMLLGLLAAPGQETIRVQTALVSVPMIVTDADGRYVPGLQARDFGLFDEGVPRQIAFFAATDEPLNVALLLDTSKSTVAVLNRIKKAGLKFLRKLRPRDRALIASFDSSIKVVCPLTDDRKDLEESIRGIKPGEYVGTKLRDALVKISGDRLKKILGRKAVILLTDGQDFGSEASHAQALAAATDAGVVVYPVLYAIDPAETMKKLFGVSVRLPRRASGPGPDWMEREKKAAKLMEELSSESAGRTYRVEVTDLDEAFAKVSEELRYQYQMAFYPDPSRYDGKPHELRIEVSRPGVQIRSRSSYRVTQ